MTNKKYKIFHDGLDWAIKKPPKRLNPAIFCPSRDIFQARLDHLLNILPRQLKNKNLAFLLIAVIGEIGNNSFDHNLGNWRDINGIYFNFDLASRLIALADRGQGVLATIKKVRPKVSNDAAALKIAFTEIISGRYPEQRGNGLKFVSKIIRENNFKLRFFSGKASILINAKGLKIKKEIKKIPGTLAIIKF